MKNASLQTGLLAFLFILIWSSAPVATKIGLAYTAPFVFLSVRLILASLLLIPLCFIMRAPWPKDWAILKHVIAVGFLIQGVYLGASFLAMSYQTTPALFAIVLGTQPMLTAILCYWWFKDTVTSTQWLGLLLGFIGLIIVTAHSFSVHQLDWKNFLMLITALLGITLGTIYQKRKCGQADHRTICALQNLIGIIPNVLLACYLDPLTIHWTWQFSFSLFWMTVPVSVCAFIILNVLIKRGDVTKVSSLFYLMPPSTAFMAYFIFGETLTITTLLSLLIITLGIFLVNHPVRRKA